MSESMLLKEKINSYIDKMPPLPVSVSKVLELTRQPNVTATDLNKVISLDPVLLAKVMRLINSAYYGLSQEVTSLARAIVMLGINTVKNLALSTAVLATMNQSKSNMAVLNMEAFWLHSLAVGTTSKLIARERGVDPKELENYFIAGLLHDIGKIPLNNRVPEDFLQAIQEADKSRISLVEAERTVLNYTHEEAGLLIIQNWQLGDELADVAAFHHSPQTYSGLYKDLVFTVAISNYYVKIQEFGFSGDRHPVKPPANVFEQLGISWAQIQKLDENISSEIEKAKVFLKITEKT